MLQPPDAMMSTLAVFGKQLAIEMSDYCLPSFPNVV